MARQWLGLALGLGLLLACSVEAYYLPGAICTVCALRSGPDESELPSCVQEPTRANLGRGTSSPVSPGFTSVLKRGGGSPARGALRRRWCTPPGRRFIVPPVTAGATLPARRCAAGPPLTALSRAPPCPWRSPPPSAAEANSLVSSETEM